MKKFLLFAGLFLLPLFSKADPVLPIDLGAGFTAQIPLKQLDVVALWDFRSKTGLAGGETPLIAWKRFLFSGGAVTSVSGIGSPFLRTYIDLPNPVGNFATFESLKPGLFVGRNFRTNEYIFGLAASTAIW